jgi:ferredoxin
MKRITISDIIVPLAKLSFKSRFKMARTCQKIPPLAWVTNKLFFEGDNMMVIPLDSTVRETELNGKEINLNTRIPTSTDTLLPGQILKEIIKKSRNHVIMDSCLCRVSNDCKEYSHDLGCLFMGPGAKNIPLKLGKPVTPEESMKHVDKCQEEGLVHIIGRNKLDSIWLNTGPKEELLTVCNCCPCCCLWKMAPDLPDYMGRSIGPMIGVELKFNFENCSGCGKCNNDICFVNAIRLEDGKAKIDNKKCKICGRCVEICPNNALKIEMDDGAVEKTIDCVKKLVNVESN